MNTSPDDKGNINSKKETNNDEKLKALATTTTTTSRQWAGFKNPRIVRVSRTFGGKDRHSKVCTIRGLRDRRIRLSVPTAIALYDLQDRLGLSQPSKVIDWLLNATKLDIDKLPPLQIPQGNFLDFHQQSLFGQLPNPNSNVPFTPYLEAPSKERININDDVDEDEDEDAEDRSMANAQSFFPMVGSNGFGLMAPYGNMYHWDPSNLSLAQFGSHGSSSHQAQDPQMSNNNSYSNTHQLLFCPPLANSTSALFPQHDQNRFHASNGYGSVLRDFVPHEQMHSEGSNAGRQHQDKGDNN